MEKKRELLIKDIFQALTFMRRKMVSQQSANWANCGLPPAQGELLYIVEGKDGLSIKEIAEMMQVSGSAVTQLVDPLVKAGLLTREPDPRDRRTLKIGLTSEGAAKLEIFKKYHFENVSRILSPLTEQELDTLRGLLEKIISYKESATQQRTSRTRA